MKDCILVTGGAGFIGCSISSGLADTGLPLIVVDSLHPQVHPVRVRPPSLDERANLIVGDVVEDEVWNSVLSEWTPSLVVHLAAETGTGQSLTEGSRHAAVNVLGTTRMLDAFSRFEVVPKRFILTSSRAVYGEGEWQRSDGSVFYPGQRSREMLDNSIWDFEDAEALPFEASRTRTLPTSIYGATKLSQEHILNAWALSYGAATTVLRLQNVYGAGQSLNNPYTGIASLFARIAKTGLSIPLYEDGLMRRDFIYIDDVASALLKSVASTSAGGRIFDIGTGATSTIADLAGSVSRFYGAPPPHVCGKFRNGDVRHASCKSEGAADIGWRPEISMDDGVGRLCRWIDLQGGAQNV